MNNKFCFKDVKLKPGKKTLHINYDDTFERIIIQDGDKTLKYPADTPKVSDSNNFIILPKNKLLALVKSAYNCNFTEVDDKVDQLILWLKKTGNLQDEETILNIRNEQERFNEDKIHFKQSIVNIEDTMKWYLLTHNTYINKPVCCSFCKKEVPVLNDSKSRVVKFKNLKICYSCFIKNEGRFKFKIEVEY